MKSKRYLTRRGLPKRNALVVALALGMGVSALAYGQATTGAIFGSAPAGDIVQVVSNSGATRTVTVNENGSYNVSSLPLGTYTVILKKDGQTVSSRKDVQIRIGAGVAVSFSSQQNAQQLGQITVTANQLPSIDVNTSHDSTVINAEQLRKLPLGHNATSIALLTPGTMASAAFGTGINFGGSSISENAYYVNGFNTGAPYRNENFFELPYGAIAQQETLAGGFGVKYGRSDGGVISQTGKTGTNEWHYGAEIRWAPRHLAAAPHDVYNPVIGVPAQQFCNFQIDPNDVSNTQCVAGTQSYGHPGSYKPGQMRSYNNEDNSWSTVYTAYIGGPLVKDKLFFFVDAAVHNAAGSNITGPSGLATKNINTSHSTNIYGNMSWNINDNNILEFTYLSDEGKSGIGAAYNYDYSKNRSTDLYAINNQNKTDAKYEILKYTSYINENATLSVLYGHSSVKTPTLYATDTSLPYISGGQNQDPNAWAGYEARHPGQTVDPNTGIINGQINTSIFSPKQSTASHGLRVDFDYQLGNHDLGIGVDNMWYYGNAQGSSQVGGAPPSAVGPYTGYGSLDGTIWIYRTLQSGPAVEYYYVANAAGMSSKQKAYYLQDTWQITPNLILRYGVRNDSYINYNAVGQAFVDQKNQWSPRIGFSWDVNGDSSLKIYGNVGRYYIALPLNAANRAANPSSYLTQYFTYTGIDDNGAPTGLTPITSLSSPDGETGNPKDPKQVTATNLKPSYADQINLGFDAKLGQNWQYGAKLSYRRLGVAIDDVCNTSVIADKLKQMGMDPSKYSNSLGLLGCRLVNPGQTSNLLVRRDDQTLGYETVPVSFSDWGFPKKPTRRYATVNLYFAHPFDGKWSGRIDYTYTSAFGNTTGQVRPDIGQQDVSKTEDWDDPSIMVGSYGELLSARRHTLRLRGHYAITPEWGVGLTAQIQSGLPRECLGYYGPDAIGDPVGYNRHGGGNYHYCAGHIVHPGSDSPYAGHTSWLHQYNLTFSYSPSAFDHHLTAQVIVYNVTNEQKGTIANPNFVASEHVVANSFHFPQSYETPRSVDLVLRYDY